MAKKPGRPIKTDKKVAASFVAMPDQVKTIKSASEKVGESISKFVAASAAEAAEAIQSRGFRLGMLFNAIQRLLESETGKPISGSLPGKIIVRPDNFHLLSGKLYGRGNEEIEEIYSIMEMDDFSSKPLDSVEECRFWAGFWKASAKARATAEKGGEKKRVKK